MICSERTTRLLPGLHQALSWLRENLPPTEREPAPVLVPIAVRPSRRRPARAGCGAHRAAGRYRPE